MNEPYIIQTASSRPTYLQVDLAALAHNFRQLKARAGAAKVMPAIKAEAYGHGLEACASTLAAAGADFLGVAVVEEGIKLRQAGISIPILVFGGIVSDQIAEYIQYDLDITASSESKLEAIDATAKRLGKRARVHLKIDTGMERIGIHYYSCEPLLQAAVHAKHLDVIGVYSHLALADADDPEFTKIQLARFLTCTEFFTKRSLPMPIRHIANSAAILRFPETHLDMVRPGISLYGIYPRRDLQSSIDLRPVMSLRSKVAYFKVVKAGAGVSYGHTWKAPCDTRMVTVPIGYADGYSRRLSNLSEVLIRGKRYPVRGIVCMDQIMVEIGDGEAYNGDEVVLLGSQGSETISAEDLAEKIGTISYEVLTSISARVPRVYQS